jgi:hypothetical protein
MKLLGESTAKNVIVKVVLAGACLACWAIPALAEVSNLEDYRARIHQAASALESLRSPDESDSGIDYEEQLNRTASELRTLLPEKESVRVGTNVVEVDNRWFSDALNYLVRPGIEPGNHEEEIDAIVGRLTALEAELQPRTGEKSAAEREENKARMAAIHRRAEFNETNKDESAISRGWRRFVRWLNSLFGSAAPVESGAVTKMSRVAQFFVYGLVGAAILFALWKLLPLLRRSRRDVKTKGRVERVILGEKLKDGETASSLLGEAESLARAGDVRGAIRKGYIALLCELAERKLLRLEQNKTNRDYLSAIKKQQVIYENMLLMTGSFERHWYGLIPASEVDWVEFRERYGEAVKSRG